MILTSSTVCHKSFWTFLYTRRKKISKTNREEGGITLFVDIFFIFQLCWYIALHKIEKIISKEHRNNFSFLSCWNSPYCNIINHHLIIKFAGYMSMWFFFCMGGGGLNLQSCWAHLDWMLILHSLFVVHLRWICIVEEMPFRETQILLLTVIDRKFELLITSTQNNIRY